MLRELTIVLLASSVGFGLMPDESVPYTYEPRATCLRGRKPVPLEPYVIEIPLGHPVTLKCNAYEKVKKERIPLVPAECPLDGHVWELPRSNASEPPAVVWSTTIDKKFAKEHFTMKEDYSLVGYFMQLAHNDSFDCHVLTEHGEYMSRVTIVIQDCNTHTELDTITKLDYLRVLWNRRNPCKYGGCFVDKVDSYDSLRCKCVEQYTGDFCDIETPGAIEREFLFYSPLFGHVFANVFFIILNCIYNRMRKGTRISLVDEVPNVGKPAEDMMLLYPAAYLEATPEQARPKDDKVPGKA
ncbi:hypothetical protein QR680_017057 [Steinernema hermaphroditum]|uniref:EGF-like domain-containing protein n=1 Tax=Steinernema hermaphroditum TaxID=289476 RepID=A0AA39LMZ2_9BILA|nr:hypothetical protein QR680_017057 [Steinernema hermaphroditum]